MRPHFLHLLYWTNKDRFLLNVDTYPNWILFAIEEGSFEFQIGEEKGIVTAGDLVLSPPFIPFRRKVIQNLSFFSINFIWKSLSGEKPITDPHRLSTIPIGKVSVLNTDRLISTYSYLKNLHNKHDPTSIHQKNHLLNDIWLLYCLESNLAKKSSWNPDHVMSVALNLIKERCFEYNFCMKNLSDDLGLTPVQFTRRFKTAYGITPSDYVTELRITRAKHLLAETTVSLQGIADICGFESGNYLSRIFSKRLNTRPTHYRRMHGIQEDNGSQQH